MRDFERNRGDWRGSIAFFLILFLLFGLISSKTERVMLNNDRIVPSRNRSMYRVRREPAGSIDVLIVGDSLSYTSVSPMQLWKAHGFTSYVCGQWGQKIRETEEMLRTVLRTQTPRLVILETDVLFRPQRKVRTLNDGIETILNQYAPVFRGHDIWKSLIIRKNHNPEYYKGFIVRRRVKPYEKGDYMKKRRKKIKLQNTVLTHMDNIISLCEESGAELLLLGAPSPVNYDYARNKAVSDYVKKNSLDWLDMNLSGAWKYQVYSCVQLFETGLSFLVFLLIVLLGIRRKMSYIRQLSDEVEVLEGGCLNCPITVRGCDELSVLAEGLDSMRRTFLDSQKREAEMIRDHQQVITEMSHDLRTPVTAIMLYAEILLAGKTKDDNQKTQYIQKIDQKALQLKERTDSLLNYSLGTCKETKTDMEEDSFSEVFYELLSETSCYLEQRGFRTEMHVRWAAVQIRYNTDYLVRIMDNIMSNIVKYADPEYPIKIEEVEREDAIGLLFQNRIAVTDETVEGNKRTVPAVVIWVNTLKIPVNLFCTAQPVLRRAAGCRICARRSWK